MNFKDVMLAYGKLDRNLMAKGFFQGCLGFEFSGTRHADSERRIMGVARRALATRVCTTENLVSRPLRQLGAGFPDAQAPWRPQCWKISGCDCMLRKVQGALLCCLFWQVRGLLLCRCGMCRAPGA